MPSEVNEYSEPINVAGIPNDVPIICSLMPDIPTIQIFMGRQLTSLVKTADFFVSPKVHLSWSQNASGIHYSQSNSVPGSLIQVLEHVGEKQSIGRGNSQMYKRCQPRAKQEEREFVRWSIASVQKCWSLQKHGMKPCGTTAPWTCKVLDCERLPIHPESDETETAMRRTNVHKNEPGTATS